ncbi:MAG: hypothetical protein ACRDIV_18925 [Ktedonobacteraceae bacterium]
MFNQMTDRLRLVEVEIFMGFPAFNHTLHVIDSVSQEVFRGDGYIGFVRKDTARARGVEQLKVRRGDAIYKVNLIPQPSSFTGTLSTRDKYRCTYDMPINLIVSSPFLFLQEYRRSSDPVRSAVEQFKRWYENHATNFDHDQIASISLPVENWNVVLNRYTGLQITQRGNPVVRKDPKRVEEFTIQHDKNLKIAVLRAEAAVQQVEDELRCEQESKQNDYKQQEEDKQKTFEREQKTKEHMYLLRKKFRDAAANELTAILQERIRESFERGRTIGEISGEYFMLMDTFREALHLDVENSSGDNLHMDDALSRSGRSTEHDVVEGALSQMQADKADQAEALSDETSTDHSFKGDSPQQ